MSWDGDGGNGRGRHSNGNSSGCHDPGGGRGGPGGGRGGPGGGRGGPGGHWGGLGGGRGGPGGHWGGPGGGRGGGGHWGGPGGGRGGHSGGWRGPGGGCGRGPGGGWGGPGGGWGGRGGSCGGRGNGCHGGDDGCSITPPSIPVKKLEAKGGETGAVWDDGHHDDIKKVYVGQGTDGISAVKFEYINGSQVVFGDEHGKPTGLGYEDFELEAGEYVTSVEGTYDQIFGHASAILTMLLFKTNLNKTKGPFGLETQSRFEFKEEGYKITGFHGREGDVVHAIGVYLTPIGTTPLKPATPA